MASLLRLILALCLPLFLTARAEAPITIGTEDAWFPFSYADRGEARGYLVDLVREAYLAVGVAVRFDVLPYARCIQMTRLGKLLACTDTPPMPAYQDQYLWHKTPTLESNIAIYAHRDNPTTQASVADLHGRRVLITHGYPYGDVFDNDRRIQKIPVQREEVVLKQLAAGHSEFGLVNTAAEPILLTLLSPEERSRVRRISEYPQAPLYVAFSKQRAESVRYAELLDRGLAQIVKNGTVSKLKKQWLDQPPPRP